MPPGVGVGQQVAVEGGRAAAGEAHRRGAGRADLHARAGERVEARLGDDVAPGGRVVSAARPGRRRLAERGRRAHQDGDRHQRRRVGRPHQARARGQAAHGGGRVGVAHGRQDHHEGPPDAERHQAGRRHQRVADRQGAGAGDEEGRDRQAREQAHAEAGAVGERPDGQGPVPAPALGHLPARAGHRAGDEPDLARGGDQREGGHDGEGDRAVERRAGEAEQGAQGGRGEHGRRARRARGRCGSGGGSRTRRE